VERGYRVSSLRWLLTRSLKNKGFGGESNFYAENYYLTLEGPRITLNCLVLSTLLLWRTGYLREMLCCVVAGCPSRLSPLVSLLTYWANGFKRFLF